MRIEPSPSVAIAYDRRRGGSDRRASADRRETRQDRRRARCTSAPWLNAPFAAQLITQCLFEDAANPQDAFKAYARADAAG